MGNLLWRDNNNNFAGCLSLYFNEKYKSRILEKLHDVSKPAILKLPIMYKTSDTVQK